MNEVNDEISLKEIMSIILKGKMTILIVTIVFTLVGGSVSYFFLTPQYQTTATLLVNSVNQEENETSTSTYTEYLNEAVSPDVFKERLTSLELLQAVKDNNPDSDLTVRQLQKSLSVELTEGSNIINLTFTGVNPEEIQTALSSVINEAKVYTGELISNRLIDLSEQYKAQAEEEKNSLDQLLVEYNDIRASEGLPSIVILNAVTSSTNQFILDIDNEKLEEFNNLDRVKQVEFEKINSKIETLTSLYNEYYSNYEEGRSLASMYKVDNKISVLSNAYEPIDPISPNVLLNTAIAFVLGLMLSVGYVFLRSYWKENNGK